MKFFCVRKTQRLSVYALSKSPNIYSLKPLTLNFLPFFTITILPFSRYFLHFLSLSALIFLYTSSSYHPLLLLFSSSSCPKILHRYSIVTPSLLHRNYGVSMEYVWSILWGRTEFQGKEKKRKMILFGRNFEAWRIIWVAILFVFPERMFGWVRTLEFHEEWFMLQKIYFVKLPFFTIISSLKIKKI